jgi:hypothetical protein
MKIVTLIRINIIVAFALFQASTCYAQTNTSISISPPQSEFDASHDYHTGLLKLAFSLTEEEFGKIELNIYPQVLQQGRALRELKANRTIDVYFAGTNIEREKELQAIRIPLSKGILGYRGLIIHKSKIKHFEKIKTLSDLKPLTACQGMHWPDSDILENADIKVQRVAIYEQMFDMVDAGRCDYFPRAMHEGFVEIQARAEKFPELAWYTDLIIQYPFPMYFFTSKENIALAERLEKGLMIAINNGQFIEYMQQHKTTQHLFPMTNWLDNRMIHLENPNLPADTNTNNEQLWLQ